MVRAILNVPLSILLLAPVGVDDGPPRPDLQGTVVNQSGTALVSATVLIYTAGVRRGTSPN